MLLTSQNTPDELCQNYSLKIDYKHYNRCRGQILSVSTSLNACQMAKHLNMKLIYSYTLKGLLYKHVTGFKPGNFWLLSYQIHGNTQCLWKLHNKLGHQGATHVYCLIKHQYYWKGMNKDTRKYIANCTICLREKKQGSLISPCK